jgi:hypothetical protein
MILCQDKAALGYRGKVMIEPLPQAFQVCEGAAPARRLIDDE